MKDKHIQIRIKQCLELAEASNCPRRKFGALLLDPHRNVVLIDAYNGGPRGGGDLCNGIWCKRDGAPSTDWRDYTTVNVEGQIHITHQGRHLTTMPDNGSSEELIQDFIKMNPPIASGTQIEHGCHHAEMNIICNAAANGIRTSNSWLIVTGEPCIMCAKLIHHAGIEKVICVRGGYHGGDQGIQYLQSHSIQVDFVDGPKDPRSTTTSGL